MRPDFKRSLGIAIEFVEHHAGAGSQIERGTVGQRDSDRAVVARDNDVALKERQSDMRRDRRAAADDMGRPDNCANFADNCVALVCLHDRARLIAGATVHLIPPAPAGHTPAPAGSAWLVAFV